MQSDNLQKYKCAHLDKPKHNHTGGMQNQCNRNATVLCILYSVLKAEHVQHKARVCLLFFIIS